MIKFKLRVGFQCIFILFALFSFKSFADILKVEPLVKGCKAAAGLYSDNRDLRFFASTTASVSDALLAGYCRGVIDQYLQEHNCGNYDWYALAKVIAALDIKNNDINYMLQAICYEKY